MLVALDAWPGFPPAQKHFEQARRRLERHFRDDRTYPPDAEFNGSDSFSLVAQYIRVGVHPGNARCAVRLGIHSVTYSDSRDGFRICLGKPP